MKKAIEIKGKRHFTAEYAEKNKNVGEKTKGKREINHGKSRKLKAKSRFHAKTLRTQREKRPLTSFLLLPVADLDIILHNI